MFAKSFLLAALVASVAAAPLGTAPADPATTTADQVLAEVASGQLSLPPPGVPFFLSHTRKGGEDPV